MIYIDIMSNFEQFGGLGIWIILALLRNYEVHFSREILKEKLRHCVSFIYIKEYKQLNMRVYMSRKFLSPRKSQFECGGDENVVKIVFLTVYYWTLLELTFPIPHFILHSIRNTLYFFRSCMQFFQSRQGSDYAAILKNALVNIK